MLEGGGRRECSLLPEHEGRAERALLLFGEIVAFRHSAALRHFGGSLAQGIG